MDKSEARAIHQRGICWRRNLDSRRFRRVFGSHTITSVPPSTTREDYEKRTNTCVENGEQDMVLIGCSYPLTKTMPNADSFRPSVTTAQNRACIFLNGT